MTVKANGKKLDARNVEVVPYHSEWPEVFELESKKIKEALGDNCIAIHHVGSTSVPGLSSKPIIDMVPVVLDIYAVDAQNDKMASLGYAVKGEAGMLFRRYFQKENANVHVYERGTEEIDRYLKFRDWMCSHEEDKTAYANLKIRLAKQFPNDILSYCLGKDEFVANIDAKTGWNGTRIVIALTPKEWESYHRIRGAEIFAPIHIEYDRHHPTLTAENYFHFVLYKGTAIVCVCAVEFLNKKEAALRALATDSRFQRQGFGKIMVESLERWIKHQGKNIVKLHARLSAEKFYRNLGYIDMEFDDQSIGKDNINLGKVL